MARFIGIDYNIGVFVGLVGVLGSVLGGMKSVTWTQVAQYIILIISLPGAGGIPVRDPVLDPDSRAHLRRRLLQQNNATVLGDPWT